MYPAAAFPNAPAHDGAGFSYNVGRVFSRCGVVFFGLFRKVADYTQTLIFASLLFIPASAIALFLPGATVGVRDTPRGMPAVVVGPPVD